MERHDVEHLLDVQLDTLSLTDLRAFLLALGEGKVSGAARRLGVTQPAVSARLKSLREHFNQAEQEGPELHLLAETRGRAGVRATASGKIVEQYAAQILRLVADMNREVDQLRRGVVGQIRVGASVTFAENVMPQLIAGFHRDYPAYRVDLHAGNARQVQQLVREGGLDFGIVASDPNEDGWIKRPVCTDRVVAFVAAGSGVGRRAFADPQQQFIVREVESQAYSHARKFLRLHGRELDFYMVGNTNTAVINLTRAGLGIGILSELAIGREQQAGQVEQVDGQLRAEARRHHAICRPQLHEPGHPELSLPAQALWEYLDERRVGEVIAQVIGRGGARIAAS
jgi:DNA-binding transcriptional LysR family regulator